MPIFGILSTNLKKYCIISKNKERYAMTVTINNPSVDFLKVLKSLVKLESGVKMTISKDKDYSKIEKSIKEFEKEKKLGKTKIYDSFEDFEKDING